MEYKGEPDILGRHADKQKNSPLSLFICSSHSQNLPFSSSPSLGKLFVQSASERRCQLFNRLCFSCLYACLPAK